MSHIVQGLCRGWADVPIVLLDAFPHGSWNAMVNAAGDRSLMLAAFD